MSGPTTFGPDPIDLTDPTPYTALPYYGHIAIGLFCFASALMAFWAIKGSRIHIRAGQIYILSTFVVCATAAAMLVVAFVPPLMLAACTALYAVVTAWLALQPRRRSVKIAEYALSLAELAALVAFLAMAYAGYRAGAIPFVALPVLSIIPVILLIGDVNHFLRSGSAAMRVRRHMARMVWAFIVVLRAPLVELAAGGLPIPQPVLLIAPILLGAAMVWYFNARATPRSGGRVRAA